MPRQKKSDDKQLTPEHFVYCNSKQNNCTNTSCARNQDYMPYDEVCYRSVWVPDKDGDCDGYTPREVL